MKQAGLAVDLFADSAIADPYPIYRAIRNCGPAVWLQAHGVWGIGRFRDVRAALRADSVLVSSRGVSMNPVLNERPARVTLTTDGDDHRRLRSVVMKPMMPSTVRDIEAKIQRLADDLVERLLLLESFDGIADFSRYLPVSVVSELVGLPEQGRQRMLEWGTATFDALGPTNDRSNLALPSLLEMVRYAANVDRASLSPNSWAAQLFEAADDGRVELADVAGMMVDYLGPSLDTTILGTGHLLFQLGQHPDQWALLRENHALIPNAADEALRLEAPVRAFTRVALDDYDVDGTTIPAGDRALVIFGSANRDERHYADPDRFDVTRDAKDHLGFGYGVHRCAGAYLAQLEMQSLLRAMVGRVHRIEVGEPDVLINSILRGYRTFRAVFR